METQNNYAHQLYHFKMQVVKEQCIPYSCQDFKIKSSRDAYTILKELYNIDDIIVCEKSQVLFLNNANKVVGTYTLSTGGMTSTVIDVRLLMRSAILSGATSIILSHSHPSGNLKPSNADINITKKIDEASSLLEIKLLDHLIITEDGYYSMADNFDY